MEIKKTTLEIISIKRDEIENLRKEGIDPFGQRFERMADTLGRMVC